MKAVLFNRPVPLQQFTELLADLKTGKWPGC